MFTFELEFHDSNLEEVIVNDHEVELRLQNAVLLVIDPDGVWLENESHDIPASIVIRDPKSDVYPVPGWLYHGWLVNKITNEELLGTLPINLSIFAPIAFTVGDETGDKIIHGSGIEVRVKKEDLPQKFL